MKLEDAKVCILRVGGTNCDSETKRAFQASNIPAEIIHFNQLIKQQNLFDYDAIVIPGGFSHGDYVRAGAIWAKQLMAKLGKDIKQFVAEEKLLFGICNGFQVLVEAGLLPQNNGISMFPEAALSTNIPSGYRCRWIHLRHENAGNCVFTSEVQRGSVLRIPIAHSEGRFVLPKEKEENYLEKMFDNDQVVFRYCHNNGEFANEKYPTNPNGSLHDIAGICDPSGTIFGLMPHPERAYFGWQLPDWTAKKTMPTYGDGKLIFDSIAKQIKKIN